MATGQETTNFDWQNNYTAHLTADITSSSTDIFLDTVPTPSEGILVIDPDTPANFEVIFYNSKSATKVTCPSAALGRGYDGSTATSHLTGTKVIMAPVGDMFRYIRTLATTTPQGWTALSQAPNTVTYNGNRSYTCVFNSVDYSATLSAGMRLYLTRTVAGPTQCTSLNGTTQFYNKTSPAGMTFTDDFVVSAWVKLSSYSTNDMAIMSRYNGTSGWALGLSANTGQVFLAGWNGGAANFSQVVSTTSLPLNRWVHVAAQLDMSAFTATTTTSYVMIDGLGTPATVSRGGTNPTALVQAGNLEVGSYNAGTKLFPGKIAQAAVFSAKVTQATILTYISQSLAGTETNLISAYSFNNTINDLNTSNANNLTANGSAAATNADSPYGNQADGTISSTKEYGIIQSVAFSTNTTLVVQVPEGCAFPVSGGLTAASYSTQKLPYGFPADPGKWEVVLLSNALDVASGVSSATYYNPDSLSFTIPIGVYDVYYELSLYQTNGTANIAAPYAALSTANNSFSDNDFITRWVSRASTTSSQETTVFRRKILTFSSATVYYLVTKTDVTGGTTNIGFNGAGSPTIVKALNAYL